MVAILCVHSAKRACFFASSAFVCASSWRESSHADSCASISRTTLEIRFSCARASERTDSSSRCSKWYFSKSAARRSALASSSTFRCVCVPKSSRSETMACISSCSVSSSALMRAACDSLPVRMAWTCSCSSHFCSSVSSCSVFNICSVVARCADVRRFCAASAWSFATSSWGCATSELAVALSANMPLSTAGSSAGTGIFRTAACVKCTHTQNSFIPTPASGFATAVTQIAFSVCLSNLLFERKSQVSCAVNVRVPSLSCCWNHCSYCRACCGVTTFMSKVDGFLRSFFAAVTSCMAV